MALARGLFLYYSMRIYTHKRLNERNIYATRRGLLFCVVERVLTKNNEFISPSARYSASPVWESGQSYTPGNHEHNHGDGKATGSKLLCQMQRIVMLQPLLNITSYAGKSKSSSGNLKASWG